MIFSRLLAWRRPISALRAELDYWRAYGQRPLLFWRDDDLRRRSPELTTILRISAEIRVPVLFAAIPTALTTDAVAEVSALETSRIAVHGYKHRNHSLTEEKSEYPPERNIDDVFYELVKARTLAQEISRDRFCNIFVPPWNRFAPRFGLLLKRAGYVGVSARPELSPDAAPDLTLLHCQLRGDRARIPIPLMIGGLTKQLQLHRASGQWKQPIGILTHHRYGEDLLHHFKEFLKALPLDEFDFNAVDCVDDVRSKLED